MHGYLYRENGVDYKMKQCEMKWLIGKLGVIKMEFN
jgi:hypothetical protein